MPQRSTGIKAGGLRPKTAPKSNLSVTIVDHKQPSLAASSTAVSNTAAAGTSTRAEPEVENGDATAKVSNKQLSTNGAAHDSSTASGMNNGLNPDGSKRTRQARALCRSASLSSLAALLTQPIGGWEDQKGSKEETASTDEEGADEDHNEIDDSFLETDRVVRATLISPSSCSMKISAPGRTDSALETEKCSTTMTRSRGTRHLFNQQVEVMIGNSGTVDSSSIVYIIKSRQPSTKPTSIYMRHQYKSLVTNGKSSREDKKSSREDAEILLRIAPKDMSVGAAQLKRSTGTITWWAPTDPGYNFPTAWGLEFATREQFLGFKVLLADCHHTNMQLARVQVHTPTCNELSKEEYENTLPKEMAPYTPPTEYIQAAQCSQEAWSARGWLAGACAPLYTLDDSDCEWLQATVHKLQQDSSDNPSEVAAFSLSELQLEKLIDNFEQASIGAEKLVDCETILGMLSQLKNVSTKGGGLPSNKAVAAAHEYWLQLREKAGCSLISRYQLPKSDGVGGTFMCGQQQARDKAAAQKRQAMKTAVNKATSPTGFHNGRKRFKKASNLPAKKKKMVTFPGRIDRNGHNGLNGLNVVDQPKMLQQANPKSPTPTNVAAMAAAAAAAAVAAVAQQVCNAVVGKKSANLAEAITAASSPRSPSPTQKSPNCTTPAQIEVQPIPSMVPTEQTLFHFDSGSSHLDSKNANGMKEKGYDTEDSDSDDEYLHGYVQMGNQSTMDGSQFLSLPPETGLEGMNTSEIGNGSKLQPMDILVDPDPCVPSYVAPSQSNDVGTSWKRVSLDKDLEPFRNGMGEEIDMAQVDEMLDAPIEDSHNQICSSMNEGSRNQNTWSQSKVITCP